MEYDELKNMSILFANDDYKTIDYKSKIADVEIDLLSLNCVNKSQYNPGINTKMNLLS